MTMLRPIYMLIGLFAICNALPVAALAAIEPGTHSVITFASHKQAIAILAADDGYASRMSPFDRMLRMKSTAPVTKAQFLERVSATALSWTSADRNRIGSLLQRLSSALAGYRLPLPSEVLLIKTTGNAEIGDGYTRANAIVLPQPSLAADDEALYFLLAHELFHVMTRHDQNFRAQAYALIGFRIGPEVQLPAAIAPLQITNPDAPHHDSFIDLRVGGRMITVVPILLSRSAVFDPEIGNVLDRYWTLRLMAIARPSSAATPAAQMRNGAPVLLRLNEVEGFFEQTGTNTRYVIHPDEILAENFALLVTGATVVEPARIETLRRLLLRYSTATQAAVPDPGAFRLRYDRSNESPYLSANRAG